jgi:C4-dicarboxylate-specific signal transduction histidine kinase
MMAGIEKVSIPQLGGDNWSIWKAKFQALLEYKGLMVAVEQPSSVEGRKASGQAKALMILHTEDAYVKLIVEKSTAAKAWEKLKHNFEKKSNARVVQLTGKLTNMKLGEKQTIAEYLGEFREIKEDLKAAGQTVSDLQLAVHALRGLPKGYESLSEILEAGDFELGYYTAQADAA